MENRFAQDFSAVRVHTGAAATHAARAVHARAFTVGNHIGIRDDSGPGTRIGMSVLAHELTHVLQQRHSSEGEAPTPEGVAASELEADAAVAAFGRREIATVSVGSLAPHVACLPETKSMKEADGSTVDVTRLVTRGKCGFAPETRTASQVGTARGQAFIELMICRGSAGATARGEIDFGPALNQASAATARFLRNLRSSGNRSQAVQQFERDLNAIAPRAGVRVNLQVPGVRASLGGTATASGAQGLSAQGTARVEGDIGPVTVGAQGTVTGGTNEPTAFQALITIGWGPKPTSPDCFTCSCGDPKLEFACMRHPPKPLGPPPADLPERKLPLVVPLFYEYAKTKPRGSYRDSLALAVDRLRDGYRIARIEGTCSPEGPLGRRGTEFEGNIRLAEARARKAHEDLRAAITAAQSGLSMRGLASLRAAALDASYPIEGRAELFGGSPGPEVPERDLLKHLRTELARPAPGETDPLVEAHVLSGDLPSEERQRAATQVERFRSGRGGVESIFPLFRRALIYLEPPPITLPKVTPEVAKAVLGEAIACEERHLQLFSDPGDLYEGPCRVPATRASPQ